MDGSSSAGHTQFPDQPQKRPRDQSQTDNKPHRDPITPAQLRYARRIARDGMLALPWGVQQDRVKMSDWIKAHEHLVRERPQRRSDYDAPSSKQVGYAERIARVRGRSIPDECYKSRQLMTRWIDANGWK